MSLIGRQTARETVSDNGRSMGSGLIARHEASLIVGCDRLAHRNTPPLDPELYRETISSFARRPDAGPEPWVACCESIVIITGTIGPNSGREPRAASSPQL